MTNPLQLSIDLIQRRDDVRLLMGQKYTEESAFYRRKLRQLAEAEGSTVMDVGQRLAVAMDKLGHEPSMLIAAMVDEIEGRG